MGPGPLDAAPLCVILGVGVSWGGPTGGLPEDGEGAWSVLHNRRTGPPPSSEPAPTHWEMRASEVGFREEEPVQGGAQEERFHQMGRNPRSGLRASYLALAAHRDTAAGATAPLEPPHEPQTPWSPHMSHSLPGAPT